MIQTRQMAKALLRRLGRIPFLLIPEGRWKFLMRSGVAAALGHIPPEFLANPGDTVVLIGFHRIDSVMLWSDLVGRDGRVVLIEAVPEYVRNLQQNLEHHLRWPLRNVVYVNRAVASWSGTCRMQIGKLAGFNKLDAQSIDDGLTREDFVGEIEVRSDPVDAILTELAIVSVDHVHMTISGMEVEALRGMRKTLAKPGLRVHIRSLHMKDGVLLYPQVVEIFRSNGMRVAVGRRSGRFKGRDIYGAKLPR